MVPMTVITVPTGPEGGENPETVGMVVAVVVIVAVVGRAVLAPPTGSVTVSVTLKAPAALYVCEGLTPVLVAPSPKPHTYVSDCPFGPVDFDPSKLNIEPTVPVYGPPAFAIGRALIIAVAVAVPVLPPAPVIVRVTV